MYVQRIPMLLLLVVNVYMLRPFDMYLIFILGDEIRLILFITHIVLL